jgi:hypothetical protein
MVDESGLHHLSCRFSTGRNLLQRALVSAHIPAILEPLDLAAGLRPDGVTQVPWANGKFMAWDFTCADTMAATYRTDAITTEGRVAALAEERKERKYESLAANYIFIPIACETLGGWGPAATRFLQTLGRRLNHESGNERSSEFLSQRLSMAVQRGNACCILGAIDTKNGLSELVDL